VVRAREEARTLDHNHLGPEHLLLALTHESVGGLKAKALESLGIGPDAVRQRVEEAAGRGEPAAGRGEAAPSGHIPFTPQAKKVLEPHPSGRRRGRARALGPGRRPGRDACAGDPAAGGVPASDRITTPHPRLS
jgi:ATP-dependent Clp protease ATP-binding subunit ClpA